MQTPGSCASLARALASAAALLALGCAAAPPPAGGARTARPAAGAVGYRLGDARLAGRVLELVDRQYLGADRVDFRAAVAAGLDEVGRVAREVVAEPAEDGRSVLLSAGGERRVIDLGPVDGAGAATHAIREALSFVERKVDRPDPWEVEYAAVRGLLSALDAWTLLLSPRELRELRPSGAALAGVGLVIAVREGRLTVVRALADTPAARAGLEPGDVIVEIDGHSTAGGELETAIEWIRGRPGSEVSLVVSRAGAAPRRISARREPVRQQSVRGHALLEGDVGHVVLAQFTSSTPQELTEAVERLRARAGGALRGLVIDLRGNTGGLLQTAIDAADLFLAEGTILRLEGSNGRVETREARPQKGDLALPVALLVDGETAAASEILAGALRARGRALLAGQRTFGATTVQALTDDLLPMPPLGDSPGLKVTIARWGGSRSDSAGEAGLAPDVLLVPLCSLGGEVAPFARRRGRGPGTGGDAGGGAPVLRYLAAGERDGESERRGQLACARPEPGPAGPDPAADPAVAFAARVLRKAAGPAQADLLAAARALAAERSGAEDARLGSLLAARGVDWRAGPAGGRPEPVASAPAVQAEAGGGARLAVEVQNRGTGPLWRLRARLEVKGGGPLDGQLLFWGAIGPGERRAAAAEVRLPRGARPGRHEVTVQFEEANGHAPADLLTAIEVRAGRPPAFAFGVEVDDGPDGDGLLQEGEEATLRVWVRNAGEGASGPGYVHLRNLGGDEAYLHDALAPLAPMAPSEVRSAELRLRAGAGADGPPVRLQVAVAERERDRDGAAVAPIALPRAARRVALARASGLVRTRAGEVPVHAGASTGAPVVALAGRGTTLAVTGRGGGFTRVEWGEGRRGFLEDALVEALDRGEVAGVVRERWQHAQPVIQLLPEPPGGLLEVAGTELALRGTAAFPERAGPPVPGEVSIFVNGRKAWRRATADGQREVPIDAALRLRPGWNEIAVYAGDRDGNGPSAARWLGALRR